MCRLPCVTLRGRGGGGATRHPRPGPKGCGGRCLVLGAGLCGGSCTRTSPWRSPPQRDMPCHRPRPGVPLVVDRVTRPPIDVQRLAPAQPFPTDVRGRRGWTAANGQSRVLPMCCGGSRRRQCNGGPRVHDQTRSPAAESLTAALPGHFHPSRLEPQVLWVGGGGDAPPDAEGHWCHVWVLGGRSSGLTAPLPQRPHKGPLPVPCGGPVPRPIPYEGGAPGRTGVPDHFIGRCLRPRSSVTWPCPIPVPLFTGPGPRRRRGGRPPDRGPPPAAPRRRR